jgi:hypothetical protein
MGSVNGKKFGLTCLFPIIREGREHTLQLRTHLRAMDRDNAYGSPLSEVKIIHMARFAIIDDLTYQGLPYKRDDLMSDYMLFLCDFDGSNVDALVAAMMAHIGKEMDAIWKHCVAYPGPGCASKDRLTAYFEQCQLETNLFLTDRPDDAVEDILRALVCKREFTKFVKDFQARSVGDQKAEFEAMWERLKSQRTPHRGSL